MSKFEERAFPVGKAKVDIAGLRNQLHRLKEDLARFMARKPGGTVIAPLRERIRQIESEIAQADQRARNDAASRQATEPSEAPRPTFSSTGRFPPRRR